MWNVNVMEVLFWCLFSYLVGTLSPGSFAGWLHGERVTDYGSRNAGATNVGRRYGRAWGLLCGFLDCFKGYLPGVLAMRYGHLPADLALGVGSLSVIGHVYPFWSGFRQRGKGVATSAGVLAQYHPLLLVAGLVLCACGASVTRTVSQGSLFAAAILPILAVIATVSSLMSVMACVPIAFLGLMIYMWHKENRHRMRMGTEPEIALLRGRGLSLETKEEK